MKKILLTTTALIALGIAPAAAADLAARPYTKAPAAVAMYNWSGFYAGVNGGWGSSRNRWDETTGVVFPMAAMTQPAAPSVVRSATAGRLLLGCSAWKRRAIGLTSTVAM